MKTRIMMVAAGLALGVAGVGTATYLSSSASEARPQATKEFKSARFAVENMTCATCPITVKRAMQGVAGVERVVIDFDAKTATVQFDPARTTTTAIAAASTNAGYPARVAGGS